MTRKRNSATRVTVGMTKNQRHKREARRAAQEIASGRAPEDVSASTAQPRFYLKLLTPCSRHYTDLPLPCRPQKALLAPFYRRHWHIGLEHHLFTPEIVAEHGRWWQRHSKSVRRKRGRQPLPSLLAWSAHNVVWPAERWMAEVPHILFGRHEALPSACQLRHPCVGRVHARIVCIDSALMHRFFTTCFPRVRVVRDASPVRVVVAEDARSQRVNRKPRQSGASGANQRRASPPRLRHRAETERRERSGSGASTDDDSDDVVLSSQGAKADVVGASDDADTSSEVDDAEEPEPFTTPYYCLINYHDNLVYVNRAAVRCGRSVRLEEGDIFSFLECAFAGDGGILDTVRIPQAEPEPEPSAAHAAATRSAGTKTKRRSARAEADAAPVREWLWVVADAAARLAAQELPGVEAWVRLALEKSTLACADAARAQVHSRMNESSSGQDGDAKVETDEANPSLSVNAALVVDGYVVAARRPLEVSASIAQIISLWRHLTACLAERTGQQVEAVVAAALASHRQTDCGSDLESGVSPRSPPPLAPIECRRRARSRSTSPTASTVPLNTSASASASRAALSVRAGDRGARDVSRSVHRLLTGGAVHVAGESYRDDLFRHVPYHREDWTDTIQHHVMRDVEAALEAIDVGITESVEPVHSPLAPALGVNRAQARRAFEYVTSALVSARVTRSDASRRLFGGYAAEEDNAHIVKAEPVDEDESSPHDTRSRGEGVPRRATTSRHTSTAAHPFGSVKVEHNDGIAVQEKAAAAASHTHTESEHTPLKYLVRQLSARNTTHAGQSFAVGAGGASPGRLVWEEEEEAEAQGRPEEMWSGDGFATENANTPDDNKNECGDGASPVPMPLSRSAVLFPPVEDDITSVAGTRARAYASMGAKEKDKDGDEGYQREADDPMAPIAVAQNTAPFLQVVPAELPVYVFTRRAVSPERCLRETSSWRQRWQDGSAGSSGVHGEGAGTVYYYYEEEEPEERVAGNEVDAHNAVDELKDMTHENRSAATRGQGAALRAESPSASCTPEEPVWVDETGPIKKTRRPTKGKRRR